MFCMSIPGNQLCDHLPAGFQQVLPRAHDDMSVQPYHHEGGAQTAQRQLHGALLKCKYCFLMLAHIMTQMRCTGQSSATSRKPVSSCIYRNQLHGVLTVCDKQQKLGRFL